MAMSAHSVKRPTSLLKNAPKADRPTMRSTRTPAAAMRMKSTSFARAAGRPRSTLRAASRPRRIDAIIPDAPHSSATREMSPIAESGVAISSIDCWMSFCADSVTGRKAMSSSMTLLAELVVLEHEPEDRDERDRQRKEREEHAVGDRSGVLRAAVREHVFDRPRERSRDAAHDSAEVLERPPRESLERSGGLGGGVAHPPECRGGRPPTTWPEWRPWPSGTLSPASWTRRPSLQSSSRRSR